MKRKMLLGWMLLLLALPFSALGSGQKITSWQQLESYLIDRAQMRDTDFSFTFDTALNLHKKPDETAALMQQSGMNSFQWQYSAGHIRVFNIEYSHEFAVCRSRGEVRDYLARCAQAQRGDFSLFLGKELYKEMKANQFSALQALESEVRMVSRSLSYSDQTCAVYYSNAAYEAEARLCTSLAQVMEELKAGAERMQDPIHLFCSKGIYRNLVANDTALLYEMVSALGGGSYSYTLNESGGRITLSNIRYMAGHKILHAYRTGDYSGLAQREYDTLVFAVNALNQGNMPSDLLGAEKWIHDYLCDRITYTVDPYSEEDDCAVGALLSGRANCDGYADAFYLMGSLVGMEIRCQSGDALRTDGDEGHMWNLIRLNDQWYMVDVTWNDTDGQEPSHIWYNLGADFARYSHFWQQLEGLEPMAEKTENGYRPYPIYRCYSFEDLKNITAEWKAFSADRADIFYGYGADLYADTDRTYEVMRKGGVRGSIRSVWYDRPGFVHFYGLSY